MQEPLKPAASISGHMGAPEPHDSAVKHATGRATYVDDIATPAGTLELYIAMSPHAHARGTRAEMSLMSWKASRAKDFRKGLHRLILP